MKTVTIITEEKSITLLLHKEVREDMFLIMTIVRNTSNDHLAAALSKIPAFLPAETM